MVELVRAATDPVTGARMRAPGLVDLENEIARCRRTGASLAVAYVDVVGLKIRNDSMGHAAGGELLKRIVTCIQEHLRPYDRVIRIGGDEFLCTMAGAGLEDARGRLLDVATELASGQDPASFTAGFTELREGDTLEELQARADGDMIAHRRIELGEEPAGSTD